MSFVKGLAIVFVQYAIGVLFTALVLGGWIIIPELLKSCH